MGAYLSEPITKKESENGEGNGLIFGASSMQGWRVSQEDSHNAIINFDELMSFFGVYDGHGGAEVAIYLSRHLPEFLKKTKEYQDMDRESIKKALHTAFVSIDKSIKSKEVLEEIQAIAKGSNENKGEEAPTLGLDYEEENVSELYEEATMPLESLVAKYQAAKGMLGGICRESADQEDKPCSSKSLLISKPSTNLNAEGGNATVPKKKENGCHLDKSVDSTTGLKSGSVNTEVINGEKKDKEQQNHTPEGSSENSTGTSAATQENGDNKGDIQVAEETETVSAAEKQKVVAGDSGTLVAENSVKLEQEGAVASGPGELKIKRKAALYQAILNQVEYCSESSSDSEEDDSFKLPKGPNSEAFDDSSSNEEGMDNDNSETSSEEMEEEEEIESDEDDDEFLNDVQEPGFDSGSTACCALTKWENDLLHLWVANAGDSRCVVSRNGKAIEMSQDHKPESEKEANRIVKAGGKVTADGRVNGGLNLSRAIGDHSYKLNSSLDLEEQMITPVPDIEHIVLDPTTDEFIVLACDGIWNSKNSQEVVDFISQRLNNTERLSDICEQLFESCLASDTSGDGTGCDNMTAVIIRLQQFKNGKRNLTDIEEKENNVKRVKLDIELGNENVDTKVQPS